eukprot:35983-Prymnesium_polylepis.2
MSTMRPVASVPASRTNRVNVTCSQARGSHHHPKGLPDWCMCPPHQGRPAKHLLRHYRTATHVSAISTVRPVASVPANRTNR